MFARIQRSFELTKTSWHLLMKDKELALLPVLSGALILGICALFMVPIAFVMMTGEGAPSVGSIGSGGSIGSVGTEDEFGAWWLLLTIPMYMAIYSVSIFFQAAVIAGATERMNGGDPTLRSALAAAWRRKGTILAWGAVAGTVGLILRSIQERSQLLGKLVIGLVGAAWSLATFFVVPVLVLEGLDVRAAFRSSTALFRQRWGEAAIGSGGIALALFLCALPLMALVGLAVWAGMPVVGITIAVPAGLALAVLGSALQGIFVAVLYRYARTEELPTGVDRALVAQAFRTK